MANSTPTPGAIPTVSIVKSAPVVVPTVALPKKPTATPLPSPTPKVKKHPAKKHPSKKPTVKIATQTWIWAFLTSYCPGSAGWISSSGRGVYYGMLANNYYTFGTRVYLPVIGLTGVVEDRMNPYAAWNQFDVWSPTCYSTPTGWYKVAVLLH